MKPSGLRLFCLWEVFAYFQLGCLYFIVEFKDSGFKIKIIVGFIYIFIHILCDILNYLRKIIIPFDKWSWTLKKAEHQRIDAFEVWC